MKNPFPGMNPYLERHWGDVHTTLMVYIRDQINEQLPGDLEARVEESVSIDMGEEHVRTVYPDVRVVEEPGQFWTGETDSSAVAVAEPCVVAIPDERPTMRHIEIIDRNSGHRVVTAIELLSPTNKDDDEGTKAYRRKQSEYFQGAVNLVEIDLIRGGAFVLAVPKHNLPKKCGTPYLICVRRVTRPEDAEVYPVPLREPLPNIRIPLRPTDHDIVLQLQPLIADCYRRGRYSSIDYRQPLETPLSAKDEAWADQLLRPQGLK